MFNNQGIELLVVLEGVIEPERNEKYKALKESTKVRKIRDNLKPSSQW